MRHCVMKVWFRAEPLKEKEQALLAAVLAAHDASARRANLSADAVLRSAIGAGDYFKAIAAGLLTMGGAHGPVEQTIDFLSSENPAKHADALVASGFKVPGWGNSFYKGKPDELWEEVDFVLREHFTEWAEKLDSVTESLKKKVYPNPSAYTAVTALILGAPKESAAYLLIAGRLAAWSEAFQNIVRKT